MIKNCTKWIAAAMVPAITLAALPAAGLARTHYTGAVPLSLMASHGVARTASHRTQLAHHKKLVKHKKARRHKHHKKA